MLFSDSGKGLTLVVSVIEGECDDQTHNAETAKVSIMELMKKDRTKGFAEVIVARDKGQGLSYL